jgi:hypothetical protein
MLHRGDVGAQGAAAKIIQRGVHFFSRDAPYNGQKLRQNPLTVALADRPKPHRSGDEIGGERQYERLKRRFQRQIMSGRGQRHRDRISDHFIVIIIDKAENGRAPRITYRRKKGAALRDRLETPLCGSSERHREFVDLTERDLVPRDRRSESQRK